MGAIFLFIWTYALGFSGLLGRAINPNLSVPDEAGPWLAVNVMPKVLGGIVMAGIVAGIQTTVAAMAIIVTSSIAKNVLRELKPSISIQEVKIASRWTMGLCLAIAILLALFEPPLIQWIVYFSVGGMEAATFGPILLGMFWKRGNKWGTLAAIGVGMVLYALANTVLPQLQILGMHAYFVPLVAAVFVYIVVSLATPRPSEAVVQTFWGKSQSHN